ncbi:MAG: hypothetical protein GY701_22950, partial [Sulfitobacter sp.]|nr:hypothetical protein [Sulfitobacter sp.]
MALKIKYAGSRDMLRGMDDYFQGVAERQAAIVEYQQAQAVQRQVLMLAEHEPQALESEEFIYSIVEGNYTDEEALALARDSMSMLDLEQKIAMVEQFDDKVQISHFDGFPQSVQDAMLASGYVRPEEGNKRPWDIGVGLNLGGLAGSVGSALDMLPTNQVKKKALGAIPGDPVGRVFDAIGGGPTTDEQGNEVPGPSGFEGIGNRLPNLEVGTLGPAHEGAHPALQAAGLVGTGIGQAATLPMRTGRDFLVGEDVKDIPLINSIPGVTESGEFLGADKLGVLPFFEAGERAVSRGVRTGHRLDEYYDRTQDGKRQHGFWLWDVVTGKSSLWEGLDSQAEHTAHMMNPSNLIRAWQDVELGEETFKLDSLDEVDVMFGNNKERRELAELYASGKYEWHEIIPIMAERGYRSYSIEASPETYHQAINRVLTFTGGADELTSTQEENLQAIELLRSSKLSFGRGAVRDHPFGVPWELDPETGLGKAVSGTLDGIAILVLEPTLVAGKIKKVRTAALWGIGSRNQMSRIDEVRDLLVLRKRSAELGEDVGSAMEAAVRRRVEGFSLNPAGRPQSYSEGLAARVFVNKRSLAKTADAHARELKLMQKAFDPSDPYTEGMWLMDRPHMAGAVDRVEKFMLANGKAAFGYPGKSGFDGIFHFLQSEEGIKALLGKMGGINPNYRVLPRMTRAGQARLAGRRWYNDADEWARQIIPEGQVRDDLAEEARKITNLHDEATYSAQLNQWEAKAKQAARSRLDPRQLPRTIARPFFEVADAFTTHVPLNGNHIPLSGDEAVRDFMNVVAFNNFNRYGILDTEEVVTNFVKASIGERRLIAQSFLVDLFHQSGAINHLQGDARVVLEKILATKFQRYTMSEADQLQYGGLHTRAALIPGAQTSDVMHIPDLREFLNATRRATAMRRIFHSTPVGYVEAAMSRVWKPMQLMTMSFAMRASGEEAISFALRTSPFQYLVSAKFGRWEAGISRSRRSSAWIWDEGKKKWVRDTVQEAVELAAFGPVSAAARRGELSLAMTTQEAVMRGRISRTLHWLQNRRILAPGFNVGDELHRAGLSSHNLNHISYSMLSQEVGDDLMDWALRNSDELGLSNSSEAMEWLTARLLGNRAKARGLATAASRRSSALNTLENLSHTWQSTRFRKTIEMWKSRKFVSRQQFGWAMIETYTKQDRTLARIAGYDNPFHDIAFSHRALAGDPQIMRAFMETNSAGSVFGRAALADGSLLVGGARSRSLSPERDVRIQDSTVPSGHRVIAMQPTGTMMESTPFLNPDGTMADPTSAAINMTHNVNQIRESPHLAPFLEDLADVTSKSTSESLRPLLGQHLADYINPATGEIFGDDVVGAMRAALGNTNTYIQYRWAQFVREPTEGHLDEFLDALEDFDLNEARKRIWMRDPPSDLYHGDEPLVPVIQTDDYIDGEDSLTELFWDRIDARVKLNSTSGLVPDVSFEDVIQRVGRGERRRNIEGALSGAMERAKDTRRYASERIQAVTGRKITKANVDSFLVDPDLEEWAILWTEADSFAGLNRRTTTSEILDYLDDEVTLKSLPEADRVDNIHSPDGNLGDLRAFLTDDEIAVIDGHGLDVREVEEAIRGEGSSIGGFSLDSEQTHAFNQLEQEGVFVLDDGDLMAPDFTPQVVKSELYPRVGRNEIHPRHVESADAGDIESKVPLEEISQPVPISELRAVGEDLRDQLDSRDLARMLGATDTSRGNRLENHRVLSEPEDIGKLEHDLGSRQYGRYLSNQEMYEELDLMSHAGPRHVRPKFSETPVYAPQVDSALSRHLPDIWGDVVLEIPPNDETIQALTFGVVDRMRDAGYSEERIVDVVEAVAYGKGGVGNDAVHFTTLASFDAERLGMNRQSFSPFLTTDPDEARLVGEAFDDAMAGYFARNPQFGVTDFSPSSIGYKNIEKDEVGKLLEKPDVTRHFGMEQINPLDERTMHRYQKKADGVGESDYMLWMTEDEAAYRGIGDDPKWEIGETILASGSTDMMEIEALARKQAHEIVQVFSSPDGTILNELVSALRAGPVSPEDLIRRTPMEDMPLGIFGPAMVVSEHTRWERFVSGFFEGVADPVIHAVARNPVWHHNWSRALPQTEVIYHRFLSSGLQDELAYLLSGKGLPQAPFTQLHTEVWRQLDNPQFFDDPWVLAGRALRSNDRQAYVRHLDDAINGNLSSKTDEILNGMVADHVGEVTPKIRAGMVQRARAQAIDDVASRDVVQIKFSPEEFDRMRAIALNQANAFDEWMASANQLTNTLTVPYIDDHRIRSQFQQYIGSFVPFWYAEELFLKRTARALIESPEMFRRGQLMMDGFRTIGVVREDDFGNEVFVTPNVFNLGTTMTDSVSWAIARFTGSAPILPHADGLMGQTQYALPGYNDDFGAMAAGPMISYGIQNISSRFPELSVAFDHLAEADDRVVLGDRSPLEYFFPSWGINLIKNRWGGTDGGTRLGSDVANALKVGAVLGDLPHPDSSNDV